MNPPPFQLISYIAPGAPATRRPAEEPLPFLRPEFGFTPAWYRRHLDIDFGRAWHTDVAYRRQTISAMRNELRKRFPDLGIGGSDRPDRPLDLLTGAYGACVVSALFGLEVLYASDNWPNVAHEYLGDGALDSLQPPDLDASPFWTELMIQLDRIEAAEGCIEGFLNFQGVLNNAYRLRGQQLYVDMMESPARVKRLFEVVCDTMIEAARRLHDRQRRSGFAVRFFTVSNCLVNMVSPGQYRQLLWPLDCRIAETFGCIGIHNCAWTADPYLEHYAAVPNLAYLDMGLQSDFARARQRLPHARRAVMYTPMDLANKTLPQIEADLQTIADRLGPADLVCADIEAGTPDARIRDVAETCRRISRRRDGAK